MKVMQRRRGMINLLLLGFIAVGAGAVCKVGRADETAPVAHTEGDAVRGRGLVKTYGCYACHGTQGQGASTGPKLAPNPLPLEAFLILVRHPVNVMPPYSEKVLADADLRDIHAFLASVTTPTPEALKEIGLRRAK